MKQEKLIYNNSALDKNWVKTLNIVSYNLVFVTVLYKCC